jgi:hypothetical protein
MISAEGGKFKSKITLAGDFGPSLKVTAQMNLAALGRIVQRDRTRLKLNVRFERSVRPKDAG